jgi:hypothetical protein
MEAVHLMYEAHLALGLRHVAEGRARIRRHIALIRRLHAHGKDCALALDVLGALRRTIAVERAHLTLLRGLCGISSPAIRGDP